MVDLTLKWEKFGLARGLHEMMDCGELVDCTIMCQGQHVRAHKNVLAACSQQFREIFKANPGRDTIVVMKGINLSHLKNMLQFMYLGEVTVAQDELAEFLTTADELGISALSTKAKERSETQRPPAAPHEALSKPAVPSKRPHTEKTSRLNSESKASSSTTPPVLKPEDSDSGSVNAVCPIAEMDCEDISGQIKEEIVDVSEDEGGHIINDPLEGECSNTSSVGASLCQPSADITGQFESDPLGGGEGPSGSQNSAADQGRPWFELGLQYSDRDMDTSEASSTVVPEQSTSQQSLPSTSQGHVRDARRPMSKLSSTRAGHHITRQKRDSSNKKEKTTSPSLTCDLCHKSFATPKSLSCHTRFYHTGPDAGVRQVCKLCGKTFNLKGDLTRHERNLHGDLAVPHQCLICFKMFKNRDSCRIHQQHHRKRDQIPYKQTAGTDSE